MEFLFCPSHPTCATGRQIRAASPGLAGSWPCLCQPVVYATQTTSYTEYLGIRQHPLISYMPLTGVIILATYSYVKSTCYVTPEVYHTVYQLHDIFTTILAKICTNIYYSTSTHATTSSMTQLPLPPISQVGARDYYIHVIHGAKHIHAQCI